MLAVGILVAVLIVAVVAVVAAGRGDVLADAPPDRPDRGLPSHRPISAADLPRLRFSMALRGYRMNEVDAALERVAVAMASLEQEVAELRASRRTSGSAGSASGPAGSPAEPASPPRPAGSPPGPSPDPSAGV